MEDMQAIKDLWIEVLFRATTDILTPIRPGVRYVEDWKKDAMSWMGFYEKNYTHSSDHFGSFEWICEEFNLPADKIRKRVKQLLESDEINRTRHIKNLFLRNIYESTNCNKKFEDNKNYPTCGLRPRETTQMEGHTAA